MKLFLVLLFLSTSFLFSYEGQRKYYRADQVPENMSLATKKERFYQLIVPAVKRVHERLLFDYLRAKKNIENNRGRSRIRYLREDYKVKTNKDLLLAMKPHPPSIVIAQAAMESAWATSRFFREANNVFGMWSKNPNEPRIAAGMKRAGGRTIWLRKFYSIDESIRAYYELMSKGRAFGAFRKARYETDDVYKIVKKLDKYSEIGHVYGEELSKMIRYNKLTQHDK